VCVCVYASTSRHMIKIVMWQETSTVE